MARWQRLAVCKQIQIIWKAQIALRTSVQWKIERNGRIGLMGQHELEPKRMTSSTLLGNTALRGVSVNPLYGTTHH